MSEKQKKNNRQKRGAFKVFFLPKMQGQKHKHKKNKYYVSNSDRSPTRSIMSSGDSPSHNRTAEAYDFSPSQSDGRAQLLEAKPLGASQLEDRSGPVATTSKEVGVQSGGDKSGREEIQASVLVEPGGGKDKDEDEEKKLFGSPTLNNDEGGGDRDMEATKKDRKDDSGGRGDKEKKDKKDKFRKNGDIDKLDGVWVPKDQKKPQGEQEEDNCIVKCLYVTMTCCECSIM